MPHHHEPVFVALSLLVAVFGSWTALDLFRRVRTHIGRAQRAWLGAAAVTMGVSIWSMHFIAMLGFNPGAPVSYDPPLTLLSLLLAIGATWGAFFAAARERAGQARIFQAGLAMGAGICLMHYVGMAAVRTTVSLGYDPLLVAASFIVAVSAATAALFAARRERSMVQRAAAAVILGLAIAGMHYTAMAALRLTPMAGAMSHPGAPPVVLGAGVAAGTLLILLMALLASLYDQRLNVLAALEAGGVGYWELALSSMALQVSPKAKELLGCPPEDPFGLPELSALLAPEDEARLAQDIQDAIAARTEYQAEQLLTLADGSEKWVNVRGRVVAETAAAGPQLMVGVVFDVTERQLAFAAVAASERRQRLLVDELNHRVKNTLATVQSIARQSAKRAESAGEFVDLFESRLMALSLTHNTLTRGGWETAGLIELLRQELGPYPQEQIRLDGQEVALLPREALALAMVFHELATNAAKYGALSTPNGAVEVLWSTPNGLGGPRLSLDWIERDGPRVTPPTRRGFGSRLVEGSVAGELGGSAELTFAESGFNARLSVPLGRAQNDAAA